MEKPRLLIFYSEASGHCRKVDAYLAQIFQRGRNHHTFDVVRLRIDERPKTVALLAIQALPTIMVVQRGEIPVRLNAPRARAEIEQALSPWLQSHADDDELRRLPRPPNSPPDPNRAHFLHPHCADSSGLPAAASG